jgi:hypothetical protein
MLKYILLIYVEVKMIKKCKYCGRNFEIGNTPKIYCSNLCREKGMEITRVKSQIRSRYPAGDIDYLYGFWKLKQEVEKRLEYYNKHS